MIILSLLKKIVSILCIICLLSAQNFLFANVSAETSSPVIEVSSVKAEAGEEKNIEITISLANNPGIISMLLTVEFGEGLSLKQVNDAGVLGSTMHNPSLESPYCLSWVNDTATADYTSNGTIATLVFDYTGDKSGKYTTPITVSYNPDDYEIYNKDLEPVNFDINNGEYSICYHTKIIDIDAVKPTCTETGLTKGQICKDCQKVIVAQEEISALDHSYSTEWSVDKEPTCVEEGIKSHHCIRCEAKSNITPILTVDHTVVCDEAKAPTCTEIGLTAGKHCSVCNEIIVVQEKIPALGHTIVVDSAKDATCTENGLTEGQHCSVCNEVIVAQEESVKAKGHKTVLKNVKKATYFSKGYSGDKYCTVCKKTISKGKVLPKLILKAPKFTVKASTGQLKVTYKKVTGATGYQIKYKIGKKTYKKTYKSAKAATKVYKKLKSGKYKVQIRAFVKKNGKTAYSKWSKVKKIKVK